MARDPQLSQKASEQLGLPPGFKAYSPFPFSGMNTQSSSIAMADNEFAYIENFVKLGDGKLRTLWDVGTSAYTAPTGLTIVYYMFYTLGSSYYCAIFLSDGSAVQLNMTTAAQLSIAPAGTFYQSATGYVPYAKQWGSTYLLISNRNTQNDYWVWDGALLYGAGTIGPNSAVLTSSGFNYTSAPGVIAVGGSGTGILVQAAVSGGSVVQLQILNPGTGYLPGDVVQLLFTGGSTASSAVLVARLAAGTVAGVSISSGGTGYSASFAVTFTGGGGTGAAATATAVSGVVTNVTITNAGSGYTSAPSVSFSLGGGTGAVGVASLAPTGVGSVTVTNGGSGFTSVPLLSVSGGGGSGATAIAVLTPTSIATVNLTAGGSNYTSAPTISFTGGNSSNTGGGATATAVMAGNSVAAITLTNAGSGITAPVQAVFSGGGGSGAGATIIFVPTSIASVTVSSTGQYYVNAPSVTVQPGASPAASATLSLMPYGVSGSAMETFLSRVWLVNPATQQYSTIPAGNLYSVSAPGSVTDFATSDGGVQGLNTDAFLQTKYVNVRQSSGYLYFFGDGSVSVVSNVTSAGSPVTTTYNYQNVDPQIGLSFRDSLQDFGRSTILMNETGVYGLYGGAVTKISAKMDAVFDNAVFPVNGGITPSAAIATVHEVKHYFSLMTIVDPDTNVSRNVMVAWNEKDWTIASQSVSFTAIATQKIGSQYLAWGTDGSKLYPMFNTPSSNLTKRLDTKIYGTDRMFIQKQALSTWMQAQDNSPNQSGVSGTLSLAVSGIATLTNQNAPALTNGVYYTFNVQPSFQAPSSFWPLWGTSMGGIYFGAAGIRMSSNSPDFTLGNLVIGYTDVAAYYGQ